mgnify:FL=1
MQRNQTGHTKKVFPKGIKVFKFSKVMKEFKKTKPLLQVLRELQVGEEVVVDNKQMKTATVRKAVTALRKLGYEFKATEKGLSNKRSVTKLK